MTKEKLSLKDINLSDKRGIQEEYQAYRKRLKENYYRIKWYLRGEQIWDSLAKGTYLRKKHGNIK